MIKKELPLILLAIILISVTLAGNVNSDDPPGVDEIYDRGASWDLYKTPDGNFKKIYYPSQVNMQDSQGDYQPFEEVVSMSIQGCNIVFSYSIYELKLQPIFVMDSGAQYSCADIPDSITVNPWKTTYRGKHKYGIDFYNISDNIKNNLKYVVLHRTSVSNLTAQDFQISGRDIIIKNKIKLSHDDILKSYTIPSINRTDIVIGNLTSNFVDNSDGTWNITFDPEVSYNFSDQNNIFAKECVETAGAPLPSPSGIYADCTSVTDYTGDADLDADDSSRIAPGGSGGSWKGMYFIINIQEDVNVISEINVTTIAYEGAAGTRTQKFNVYNYTSSAFEYEESKTTDVEQNFNKSFTSGFSDFIDATTKNLTFVLYEGTATADVYGVDYFILTVTYTEFSPEISIVYPGDYTNHSSAIVDVNYTVSDANDNLQACWWTNDTGVTNNTVTCGTNITGLTWDEGLNTVIVYANDSAGNENSSTISFTVDTIYPVPAITGISTTQGSQTVKFNHTATDTNSMNCFYSVFNSTGSIDGALENVSAVCDEDETQFVVSSYATYNLTFYANDSAGNENSTTQEFTTTAAVGGEPGGGGVTIIYGLQQSALASNFSITTTNFGSILDLVLPKDSVRPRTKEFILLNKEVEPIEVELVCDTELINDTEFEGVNFSKVNICDYVEFEETAITISPNELEPAFARVYINVPENSSFGDTHLFNVLAVYTGENNQSALYAKLSVRARTPIWATMFKWSKVPFTSDEEPVKAYPVFLIAIIFSLLIFAGILAAFTVFRAKQKQLPIGGFFTGIFAFFTVLIILTFYL